MKIKEAKERDSVMASATFDRVILEGRSESYHRRCLKEMCSVRETARVRCSEIETYWRFQDNLGLE